MFALTQRRFPKAGEQNISFKKIVNGPTLHAAALDHAVERLVQATPVYDIHTHLYAPAFGELLQWGIDDLLVYHYLVAEGFRYWDFPVERFWRLDKADQAELIWTTLFDQHSPLSEACRGVLTALHALGLDVRERDLPALRRWFAQHKVEGHLMHVMDLAGVRTIGMANSPFDPAERAVWERGWTHDPRFASALRIDPLLLAWPETGRQLAGWGYDVRPDLDDGTCAEVRRFLEEWTRRMQPLYLMVSLPPDFLFPAEVPATRLLEDAILPHCAEHNLPLAFLAGVKRGVNPALELSGDGVGRANLDAYEHLCAAFPRNKFMLTALARENQHELCVLGRKFRNLHIFGCWWFLNVPSLVDETTRLRVEMLGLSFTPQHSDARVLDQLIYKWSHARRVIAEVLKEKYRELAATGWAITAHDIERDVRDLFGGAFEAFLKRTFS
jgi:hypothetical protein